MSIFVDLIVVVIFLACLALGYWKGLTGSLLKIVSFVLAIIIAFILFKPVSNLIINKTNWDENLENSIRNIIIADDGDNTQTQQGQDNKQGNMPDIIMNYINNAVENAGEQAKHTIADQASRNVAVTIINAGTWVSLFLIARIALILVRGLAKFVTDLPLIKQVDKVGGIAYGLLESLVIIYILFAIVSFISPMLSSTGIIGAIQQSHIGSIFYNHNLLLTLIF